ncbi:MAG: hypothetical protein C5B56_07145 [Proteobacteria bacterium]|nr:MAG: hypothetical protein C5B56_07145 [Pseudomonadota bacterium]
MVRHAFITITDYDFFPGTLATISSVLEFQPCADVFVIYNEKRPLTPPQFACISHGKNVSVLSSSQFAENGRFINAWELKAYAAHDLAHAYDVIVGIDSDCLLCSNVDDEIARSFQSGGVSGGKDGDGAKYDDSYRVYGLSPPAYNSRYMSTSLYFCAVTDANRRVLRKWADCCSRAVFNGTGPCPGHGDQGVLNAVLFAENRAANVQLLDNCLWSQHSVYWESIIEYRDGVFCNRSAQGQRQRAFHCGGTEKFWAKAHSTRVLDSNQAQTYPYVWFLAMLWFGASRNRVIDPLEYLPPASHHLCEDLVRFAPKIAEVYPPARGPSPDRGSQVAATHFSAASLKSNINQDYRSDPQPNSTTLEVDWS